MRLASLLPSSLRAAMIGAGVVATTAVAAVATLHVVLGEIRILPLLPLAATQPVCFSGTFQKRALNVEDWSKATLVPTGQVSPDGKPMQRRVFANLGDVGITRFVLQLDYDSRKASYDWIYNFTLLGSFDGLGELQARGECPWYAKDFLDPYYSVAANTSSLGCYIDCDGGGLQLTRIAGSRALSLAFDPTFGLRMKRGCGGGGPYRVGGNAGGGEFRLEPASPEACKALAIPE